MKEATESIVKHLLTYILLLMLEGVCLAQTSLSVSDLSVPTKIAPAYFGPNAFPVPDMMTGRTSSEWKMEVYADSFINSTYGPSEEYTASAFVRLTAPLFTDRVNLVMGTAHRIFPYWRQDMQGQKDRQHISRQQNNFRRHIHLDKLHAPDTGETRDRHFCPDSLEERLRQRLLQCQIL